MPDYTIRAAELDDIRQISMIYADSVLNDTASWEYDPPSDDEMKSRFQNIIAKNYPYIVAESNGEILGYAYVNSFRPREGYKYCVENSIYVAPNAQGRGIAKSLMGALINLCAATEIKFIIAVIGDSDNIASIKLHERFGFKHIGTFSKIGYKFDKWLDSILMQYTIADSNG